MAAILLRFASNLRFPRLAALTALLFLLDLAIPDVVPLADELLLGLTTLLLANLRKPEDAAALPGERPAQDSRVK